MNGRVCMRAKEKSLCLVLPLKWCYSRHESASGFPNCWVCMLPRFLSGSATTCVDCSESFSKSGSASRSRGTRAQRRSTTTCCQGVCVWACTPCPSSPGRHCRCSWSAKSRKADPADERVQNVLTGCRQQQNIFPCL